MSDLITLTINGREVQVPKGTLVVEAARQIGIEDVEIGMLGDGGIERRPAVVRREHRVPLHSQEQAPGFERVRIVIDEQNPTRRAAHDDE